MSIPQLPMQSSYLASKIQTASQPELHLLLVDGALRFGRQAQQAWPDRPERHRLLQRTVDAVESLVQGLAAGEGAIARQLEEQYAFIFRELVSGRINDDRSKIDTALELLAYERETWKLACDHMAQEQRQGLRQSAAATAPTPRDAAATGSLSLEA